MTDPSDGRYRSFPLVAEEDGRLIAPSSRRNGPHILRILKNILPGSGTVLEIAAGSGEHTVMFAPEFPGLAWLPSDPAEDKLQSIRAWIKERPSPNILPPVALDSTEEWDFQQSVAAMICINMIHIAPWAAAQGLFRNAGRLLPEGGVLYLYGPYNVDGQFTSESNEAFDRALKAQNSEWGLRDIAEVAAEAAKNGLRLIDVIDMPANNKSLVFKKL